MKYSYKFRVFHNVHLPYMSRNQYKLVKTLLACRTSLLLIYGYRTEKALGYWVDTWMIGHPQGHQIYLRENQAQGAEMTNGPIAGKYHAGPNYLKILHKDAAGTMGKRVLGCLMDTL